MAINGDKAMEVKEIKRTAVVEFKEDEVCEICNTLGIILRWFDSRSPSATGETHTSMISGLNKLERIFDSIRDDIFNY